MDKARLLKEYREFLKIFIKGSSIKSYVDHYLLGAFKNVINPNFEKAFNQPFDALEYFTTLNIESRRMLCEIFLMMIRQEKQNQNKQLADKTLTNYKSSFMMFNSFNDELRFRGINESKKIISAFKYDSFFTKKDVMGNFEFRINTQDRFYPKGQISLPCRLLQKIYQNDKRYTRVLENMLNKCRVLIDGNGNFIRLKKVQNISIVNNEYIVCYGPKGTTAKIYTEIYQKGNKKGFKVTTGTLLEDISLDHDKSLFEKFPIFLSSGNAPTLYTLSKDYYAYHKANKGITVSALACHYYYNRYAQLGIDEEELLKEVDKFFSGIKLTIMDKRINSSKNKN